MDSIESDHREMLKNIGIVIYTTNACSIIGSSSTVLRRTNTSPLVCASLAHSFSLLTITTTDANK